MKVERIIDESVSAIPFRVRNTERLSDIEFTKRVHAMTVEVVEVLRKHGAEPADLEEIIEGHQRGEAIEVRIKEGEQEGEE